MCSPNYSSLIDMEKQFYLEIEMLKLFGKEKTKKILSEISEYYKPLLPLQGESISFSGNGRFTKEGGFVTKFNDEKDLFNYLIVFRKKTVSKGMELDETFYYAFN